MPIQLKFYLSVLCTQPVNDETLRDNFLDPPNVTVSTTAEGPVVEGDDSVTLKCDVDANPEAEITWRKEGDR